MEEMFSTLDKRFGGRKEMMRMLIEMQSKTPPTVLIVNPNNDLIRIYLAESKGKEIRREEFEEDSSMPT
ncbi:hypothetical protein M5K25_027789 [Dendrobium thyrsiflorum]|uniref:Uncharacterized protein n=1 Tax=Dendrobium thyrsiflorum TaxID=117978 RepID=A0ABD0TUQ7_DENTH